MITNRNKEKEIIQVHPSHYFKRNYDNKARFISYWNQINEILLLEPKSVLEIGVGNSFVTNYLRERKLNLVTLDIDKRLNPDCVGSVIEIPFSNDSFEVVSCCEVLEHLPYENFSKALNEIYRVTGKYAIISLPDSTRVYKLYLHLPKIGIFQKLLSIPTFKPIPFKFDGQHYWEIGTAKYPLRRILKAFGEAKLKIIKTYRPFEAIKYRFFILSKIA